MGITGRYDFKGIQKAVGRAIDVLLAGTAWGAWIIASPFKPVVDEFRNMVVNFLVNRGLIILNIGAIMVDGKVDQAQLDAKIQDALNRMRVGRDKITPAEGKAIDDEVRDAFDNAADVGAVNGNDGVSDVHARAVSSGNHTPL